MALNIEEEIRKNKRQSIFIIFLFFIFVFLIASSIGLIISFFKTSSLNFSIILFSGFLGLIASFLYCLVFMKQGDSWILNSTGAKPVLKKNYPFLFHTVESLSLAAGMKKPPKCFVIEDSALNAYATGFSQEKSYVVVTTGLLKKLNREEIEGVLAHEISHIVNSDIKVMLLAAGLVGVSVFLSDILFHMFLFGGNRSSDSENKDNSIAIIAVIVAVLLVIISPIVANLLKLAISRKREYLADANGAKLTRYPQGLASALEKIKNDSDPLVDNANKATAHLFISTPFRSGIASSLFSTHPPIDLRIKKLRGQK